MHTDLLTMAARDRRRETASGRNERMERETEDWGGRKREEREKIGQNEQE